MPRASAADLPPELFPLIIAYAVDECFVVEDSFVSSVEWRIIGQLSLVCSYWGQHCRRHLFRGTKVMIRGASDVLALSRLLQSPVQIKPAFRTCLYEANFVLDAKVIPWIEMASCIRSLSDLEFSIIQCTRPHVFNIPAACGPAVSKDHSPDSWSHGLPRALPGSTLQMRALHLQDLRFPTLASLRGLFDLPSLREIRCRKLDFADMALPFPSRVRLPQLGNSLDVVISQCGSAENNVSILLATAAFSRALASPAYTLGVVTWAAFHEAVCGMMHHDDAGSPDAYPDCGFVGAVERTAGNAHLRLFFLRPRQTWGTILSRQREITHELTVSWPCTPATQSLRVPGTRSLTRIRVKFGDSAMSDEALAAYTRSIEDLLRAVAPYTPVVIDADENADVFSWFVERVLDTEDTPLRRQGERHALKLTLTYRAAHNGRQYREVGLRDVAHQTREHTVDDIAVTLDARGLVELRLCTLHLDAGAEAAAEKAYLGHVAKKFGLQGRDGAAHEPRKQRVESFTKFLQSSGYKTIRRSSTVTSSLYERTILREDYDHPVND
ncbi:hypothetical protein PsYK624_079080 [Phanerochaete sordida]|uniref:Uncharacterized protein n=1 Tax=Phanerochaete sordida TaxID=48140 RepID=A0A9P3GBU1_9APHY|nr:hypothetical protein PsYK624_079080 [Phanerochaete sordida]